MRRWPEPDPDDMETISDLARAAVIEMDEGRSGYIASDIAIENEKIYIATATHDGEPRLIVEPVRDFVLDRIRWGDFGGPGDPMYERACEIVGEPTLEREETK